MKAGIRVWLGMVLIATAVAVSAQAKVDPERMDRDIEVAENVLATLIKQQLAVRNNFFPVEVEGTYMEGYGVTFRLPTETFWMLPQWREEMFRVEGVVNGSGYTFDTEEDEDGRVRVVTPRAAAGSPRNSARNKRDTTAAIDYYEKVLQASKNFLADYGDMLSELRPNERITITNRHENQRFWFPGMSEGKRNYISVDVLKGDVAQFRQGKITRDQLVSKINVVNSESTDELDPDLELLSSIFNRLYRPDLSRTFFTQEEVYYERLKNFGAIFQMQVYSSNIVSDDWNREGRTRLYDMPTLNLRAIDQKTRDEKVKAIYPKFETELKENLLEYGRTVKSLKPDETLVFNVKMTRCEECGVPASLELSIKGAVLADYASARIGKDVALSKILVKKGANQ